MADINVGDVVQLKSGGPPMTVTEIGENNNEVYCEWFDKKGEPQGRHFMIEALKVITAAKDLDKNP